MAGAAALYISTHPKAKPAEVREALVARAERGPIHGDPDTYRYIPESIRRYPGAAGVADQLRAHGFTEVRIIPLLGGLMTLHVAHR